MRLLLFLLSFLTIIAGGEFAASIYTFALLMTLLLLTILIKRNHK